MSDWLGTSPQASGNGFGGGLRWSMALNTLLWSGNYALLQHWRVWGPHSFSTPTKIIPACLGWLPLSSGGIRVGKKASCEALGAHCCRRRPWLWMVVVAVGACGGSSQLTSAHVSSRQPPNCRNSTYFLRPTKNIIFLFFHRFSIFLTSDPAAKKESFRCCILKH